MQTPLRPMRNTRFARFALSLIIFTSLALALGDSRMVAQSVDPNAGGPQPRRGYFSDLPFEQIDMMNGDLHLTIPIFQLTGNAGLDLNVALTYNRNGAWRLSLGALPMSVANPDGPSEGSDVAIRTWDGSSLTAYADSALGASMYVTEGFGRYSTATRTLELPNGTSATFQSGTGSLPARLQEIHDRFGNSISMDWLDPNPASGSLVLNTVTQSSGGASRTIMFGWDGYGRLTWANFWNANADNSDRLWSFSWSGGYWTGPYQLKTIQPPVGPAWQIAYASGSGGEFNYPSMTVTTPHGGEVTYDFASSFSRYVVNSRTTGGREIVPGTWTFGYGENPVDNEQSGAVHTPQGRHIEYRHRHVAGEDIVGPDWVLTRQFLTSSTEGAVSCVDYAYTLLNVTDIKKSHAVAEQKITQAGSEFLTTYEYHTAHRADFHQPFRITETGEGTRQTTLTFTYDFSFHRAGAVQQGAVSVDSSAPITTTFTYNLSTGFLEASARAGLTTSFSPDARGNVAIFAEPGENTIASTYSWGVSTSTTNPVLSASRTLNNDGTVSSETVNGQTTTLGFDGLGRPVSVSPPMGDASWTNYAAESVTSGRGNESMVTHIDGFGRVTSTSANNGVQTTRSYDALGQVTHQSAPFVESWAAGNGYAYDGLGRVKTITHADGSAVQLNYSGGDEQRIDENGHSTTMHHRTYGSPLSGPITDLLDPAGQTWHYTYNKFGSLTVVDAPTGPDRVWNYDPQNNRLDSTSQPESGTVTYEYFPGTRLVSKKTDAAAQVVNYEYDGAKRLWKVDHEGSDEYDLTYSYEPGTGRLASIANTHASSTQVATSFQYDAAGRLANRQDQLIGQTFNTHYDYDGNDRLTVLTYPSGRVVNYNYHVGGRLASVTGPNGLVYANNFSYHANGAIAGYQLGNGTWHTQSLDNRGRPSHITSGTELDLTYSYDGVGNVTSIEDPRPDHSQWFGYDALDRLTGVSGYQGMSFSYDALGNRTTKGGTEYHYDPNTLRHIQSTGSEADFSIQYDANGNRTNDNQGAYAYRPDNLMRTATVNGNTTTYQYDGNGQRIATSNYDGIRITTHGPSGGLLSEFVWAGSPSWIRDSIYAGTQLLAIVQPAAASPLTVDNIAGTWWILGEDNVWRSCTIEDDGNGNGGVRIWNEWGDYTTGILNGSARTMETGDEWAHLITDISANTNRLLWQNGSVWVRTTNPVSDSETLLYFHVDALGSVRHGTNMSGASFARHDYGAFGEGPWTAGLDEKLRFTGAERDAETFLDYMGARYYRNVNGRFNTVDPGHVGGSVTDPQSWNAYAYARNNPLRFWDPTGTDYVIKLDGYASVQVSDATFHKLQDDPGAGLRLWLGNVQELRNGVWVTVGTYHYYDLIANVWRDAYNQSAPGVNAALAIGAVTSGGAIVGMGSVAVAGAGSMPLFGGLGGSMTATIAAIQNPAVRNAMNALYQFSDRIRGGTAAAVRFTADTLIKVGNSDHVLKAKERLASLERIVRNEPLTDSDKQLVNQVIGALKEALGWVRKKP